MQRVNQVPNVQTSYNSTNQRIYTRFHRKPQIYPTSFKINKIAQKNNLEEKNVNSLITNIYKQKKFRGMLDPASPNNRNIFIDTDSDVQLTDKVLDEYQKTHNKKSTQLLISKTESQIPETYNAHNIFIKDGLVKGYYIKVNPKKDYNTYDDTYNYINNKQNPKKDIKTVFQSPEQEFNENMIYDYNRRNHTQIRPKKEQNNYLCYTNNADMRIKNQYENEKETKDWTNFIEQDNRNNENYRNKDIQVGINPIINKMNRIQQNNQGIVYRKNNISYTKSNISDISYDLLNRQKQQQIENNMNNYIIPGTGSNIISPNIEYKNISNEYEGENNSEDSQHQNEFLLYNEPDYNNYVTNNIIRNEIIEQKKNISQDHGGKVDLNFELMNNKKDSIKRDKKSIMRKSRLNKLEHIIDSDEGKYTLLIKLQRFIKSYLYLREICAMKIQAVWRGCNTRKIMDLYNNLDEFIYHLSKVQFNHFNNNFCFFIKQLFNIYKANISNENYNDDNDEIDNNDNEIYVGGEMMGDDFIQERGAFFDPDKLETENEIALIVEGEAKNDNENINTKDYDKLKRDYDDLCQQYNELKNHKSNNKIITNTNKRGINRKEKNDFESTVGSVKSDYKLRFRTNSRDKTNYRGYSEVRQTVEDKEKSFSNDYDADLDINREEDFFNQEMSFDDKDNNVSPNNKFNYFNMLSEENSKYFDNENMKEGDTNNKNNIYNNIGKYTTKRGKYEKVGDNIIDNNNMNSPSIEKSSNYLGHNSKTFQRKYKYSEDNTLMIPKKEEEFKIIDNKEILLSPKENGNKKISEDIAITPNNRYLNKNKNWNEMNKHIKNDELSYKNKNKTDYMKIINDKENEINLLQKKLNEIKNSMSTPKIFKNNLKINNNLNEIDIKGYKPKYIGLHEIENNENIQRKKAILRNKSESNSISLRNEINLKGSKIYKLRENNKVDEIINNAQFSFIFKPKKEIKIVTKKILKKTNYIHSKFKDNKTKISFQNEFDIIRTIKENKMNKNRIFNESENKMSYANRINLKGIGKIFDNVKINKNNIESINFKAKKTNLNKKRLIPNRTYENIINIKTQFKIDGKKKITKENIINRKTQFKIDGIKKELSEKNCDTNDLLPKEIKITTKKIVKKTNIIKKRIKNEISKNNEISLEGLNEPFNQILEKEYNLKKKEWKESLKEEIQQNKFFIKRISKQIYNKLKNLKEQDNKYINENKKNIIDNHIHINIEGLEEDENYKIEMEKESNKSLKIEYVNKNNIIVKKINLKIEPTRYSSQEKKEKILINKINWNESLKIESLQSKFTIKKKKIKPIVMEVQKNKEITIGPTDDIIITKEKILGNWKNLNKEEKSEEFNIEKQPYSRQIRITTKKILKKTNYIYKKFNNENLNIIHNQLNIEGKQKIPFSELSNKNSKINIIIDETNKISRIIYKDGLKSEKVNQIFINSDKNKKKEIKITTKLSVTKTKFIHKRFKNNYISYENQINIKRQKPKQNGLDFSKENENVKSSEQLIMQNIQKKEKIQKEEKTTDTTDLERKKITITTKKIIKKTNILKTKFKNNLICENEPLFIDKVQKEKENDINNKIINFKIFIRKRNQENIINKVSQIQLCHDKNEYNKYHIFGEIKDEKNQLNDTKLHSMKNKINIDEKSVIKPKENNKNKKLKTVVVCIDKKYDLKNCFNKWNLSTINNELKNDLKKEILTKLNNRQLNNNISLENKENDKEKDEENKINEDITNYETINNEDIKNTNMNIKSSNNNKRIGKKKKIKIKYIKKNTDNSINSSKSSENKLSLSEDLSSSNDIKENKTIKYEKIKENDNDGEPKEMKSLDPKSTRRPFILRINKLEVKKKILKSNSKTIRKEENEDKKNNKIQCQYYSLIIKLFFQQWKQKELNISDRLPKSLRIHLIRCITMSKKINRFKTHLIKYIFKNK